MAKATKKAATKTVKETVKKVATKTTIKKTAKPVSNVTKKVKEVVVKKVATKKVDTKKAVVKKEEITAKTKKQDSLLVTFLLRYTTSYGQHLFITANHKLFGNDNIAKALPMQYLNNECWYVTIEILKKDIVNENIIYNYVLKDNNDNIQYDCGNDKVLNFSTIAANELLIIDSWNYTGYPQNTFYTEPFQNVLLKQNVIVENKNSLKKYTHIFKTKAPILPINCTLCILGNNSGLNNWDIENPVLMQLSKESKVYTAQANLEKTNTAIAYKYGVYNTLENKFINFEEGENRTVIDEIKVNKITIINDAFANIQTPNWRGAGVAIPVFSLKTKNSFGVGEFNDIKALADWSASVGIKLIQILPINDTTAKHTWQDSYPYAAISAFALHPMYINLQQVTDESNIKLLQKLDDKQQELNKKKVVDYEEVVATKLMYLRKIFPLQKAATFASAAFISFFKTNEHWLVPYSCFCYLRDEYKTANYNNWPAYRTYNTTDIDELCNEKSAAYNDIAFHYFVQFHLHTQLLQATEYAHSKGIIVKGDIAIGIYRYGADAWQQPQLYNMNVQAGAPPDDFAVKGQNWGFPTYNWSKMMEDGFEWWRNRFEQMSYYFDAFRIDHILGFFRIWSIPTHAVEGILGHFVPAIPVHINEFFEKGINFNHHRFTQPFINDTILHQQFGNESEYIKENFLVKSNDGNYTLLPAFATQVQVEQHFESLEKTEQNAKLKIGLYNLISNVILFDAEQNDAQHFHFRFGIEQTSSYQQLDFYTKLKLKELYVDYFFKRQDEQWKKEALQKLPALKRVTNMLICGEDLGLVPGCVPDVMQQLGLLSLEIQRMPKDSSKQFFHPNDAPYLSVVTPSTHDMSTIRGWWEEDKVSIQKFYNNELGKKGEAPFYCEPWVNKAIVAQHLYSPAMWAIFQLQDLLGIDGNLKNENPNDDRINVPANPNHYWQYRMNIGIEDLEKADEFNTTIKELIGMSGR